MDIEHREGEAILQTSAAILRPWLSWLLDQGIAYGRLQELLKDWLLSAAHAQLQDRQQRITDSALSLISGVHRKDVRRWRENAQQLPPRPGPSLSNQVFSRWLHDPRFASRRLPRGEGDGSFYALVQCVSRDVHPHSLLNELIRLGLVELDADDQVHRLRDSFIPPADSAEAWSMLTDNLADHVAAVVENLRQGPCHLEQGVFAEPLSETSVAELDALARQLWQHMHHRMLAAATQAHARDQSLDAELRRHRIRLGVYFYHQEIPS